jgi:UDPglucose 6-dehydrogenase
MPPPSAPASAPFQGRRIAVAGLWHLATVLSACLAEMGHRVRGVGDDAPTVTALNHGQSPVFEPRLEPLLRRNLRRGRLRFTTGYREALAGAEFVFLALDTPVGDDDQPDLASLFQIARSLGRGLTADTVLVISSQVPVGASERLAAAVRRENPALQVPVAYVPEFLQLGAAIDRFRRADRFVVGAADLAVAESVAALFRPLKRPIVITSLRTAEMAKHASNAFLSASVSFINEIAGMCDHAGADAVEVARIMRLDRRIGSHAFLSPGLGFAGGTLGRDVRALQDLARQHGAQSPLLDAVWSVNRARAGWVGQRLQAVLGSLEGVAVGVLGLTYKPGTSTLRRSIALEIIQRLVGLGASVRAFDPLARLSEVPDLPPFRPCPDPYSVAQDSDALVLITPWPGLELVDWPRVKAAMRRPVFLDTRNLLPPENMRALGFLYFGIGRGVAAPGAAA